MNGKKQQNGCNCEGQLTNSPVNQSTWCTSRKTLMHNINSMNVNDLTTSRLVRFRTRLGRSVPFRTVSYGLVRFGTLADASVRMSPYMTRPAQIAPIAQTSEMASKTFRAWIAAGSSGRLATNRALLIKLSPVLVEEWISRTFSNALDRLILDSL